MHGESLLSSRLGAYGMRRGDAICQALGNERGKYRNMHELLLELFSPLAN
jgi:hypothetical protein